jgi:opacity protein-like surface antigen
VVRLLHKAGKTIRAMKRILTALVILALGMTAYAQRMPQRFGGGGGREPIRRYDDRPGRGYGYGFGVGGVLEVGFSVNYFTGGKSEGAEIDRPDRIGVFGEYRMDLGGYADIGMQLSTTFGKGSVLTPLTEDKAWYWQGASLVVADFNLLPYSGFNPFVGCGVGPGFGFQKITTTNPKETEWTHALVLAPRVGIELFECFRMSVQYQWYLNDPGKFSHFSFGLSWAFEPGMGRRPFGR